MINLYDLIIYGDPESDPDPYPGRKTKPADNPVGSPSRNEKPRVDPLPRTLRLGPLGNPIPLTLRGPEWDPFKRPICKPIWTVRLYPLRGFSGVGDKFWKPIQTIGGGDRFWPHTLRDPEIDIGVTLRDPDTSGDAPITGPIPDIGRKEPDGHPIPLGPVKLPGGPVGRPYEGDSYDPLPDPCPSLPGGK